MPGDKIVGYTKVAQMVGQVIQIGAEVGQQLTLVRQIKVGKLGVANGGLRATGNIGKSNKHKSVGNTGQLEIYVKYH